LPELILIGQFLKVGSSVELIPRGVSFSHGQHNKPDTLARYRALASLSATTMAEAPPKKQASERRKQQNRVAQRGYRQFTLSPLRPRLID
jgi:hypothetical protein